MYNDGIPSLTNLIVCTREQRNDSKCTDVEAFCGAFETGMYNEEDTDWENISTLFSDAQLASLYLGVCHALACTANGRDPRLMECYDALAKWQRGQLKDTNGLSRLLAEVRRLMFDTVLEHRTLWWAGQIYPLEVLELGVALRSKRKCESIKQAYEKFGDEFGEVQHEAAR